MFKVVLILGIIVVFVTIVVKQKDMSFRQSILQKLYPIIMQFSKTKGKQHIQLNNENITAKQSIYTIQMNTIDGIAFDLQQCKGKKILIVNTASDCGFTGQYENLEKLYQKYQSQLVVIGVPSNDFKEQEKGSNESISQFCKKNYGVRFPLMNKAIVIKSAKQSPLYQWLTDLQKNGWCSTAPEWNFCKYLIDEQGNLMGYFPMTINPLEIDITRHLNVQ